MAERVRVRCVRASGHPMDEAGHIYPTRKPILDRIADGEFHGQFDLNQGIAVPGVNVPANVPQCRSWRMVSGVAAPKRRC